ncbi:UDP-N-acetyl-D-mannosamine dehydrogenase [Bermanella marisrubri]|uniref:UDP-N-acetyl-D-mannosaminuronic acid dehydrogenase n=1 Tax=Bermanella marisrubri TaxID=207949 RepID=Q1N095_9GAMM|nr:UDP-N-acetyl-D-mannosamine dehydrogenase [Bermanella marisrubri]EAT11622.1 UDP-N-acetyl-D-mannosaminuronic acid dehydrogenase [Oceanobacter sp. RED65] [Bermanella marisrubri]QIZ83335.1 UDP-N-acetyl-D-mannosamine dehydrogenase [Bermanella marisrubri]
MFKKISVIGLGYIGLPTAAVIASKGIEVIGVDVNEHAVNTINEGKIHIVEPGLEDMVKQDVEKGLLKAYLEPQEADAFLIAVPTPFKGEDHTPNLDYIEAASKAVAKVLKTGDLVILESTSPVGATEKMAAWIAEVRPDLKVSGVNADNEVDIFIAHCPERVLPGHVIRELEENDRVIGGLDEASTERATALYKTFVKGECIATNARTAEMAKLTENASRDVQIAFANELSLICDKQGIDVWELIELANRHPRVNILQPGAGVGGHCIAVDPWFIVNQNPEDAKIIHQARKTNDYKPNWVVEKIEEAVKDIENPTIACLGLAFKPDIDDLRESPALQITEKLAAKGYNILAVEPNVDALPKSLVGLENVHLVSLEEAIQETNVVGILVKHKEFTGEYFSVPTLDFVNSGGKSL